MNKANHPITADPNRTPRSKQRQTSHNENVSNSLHTLRGKYSIWTYMCQFVNTRVNGLTQPSGDTIEPAALGKPASGKPGPAMDVTTLPVT